MKAKLNYGALTGIVPVGGINFEGAVSISGGEALVQRSDELYRDGNDQDARIAMREALQAAMRRLDRVHGAGQEQNHMNSTMGEVVWEPV